MFILNIIIFDLTKALVSSKPRLLYTHKRKANMYKQGADEM